ncbi:hypothetical protein ACS0TY_016245 [Phlomoides rotata]
MDQEGKNNSSTSLFNDLFGDKDSSSPPPTHGILASIFPPPASPRGEPWRTSETEKKADSVTQVKKSVSGEEQSTKENTSYFQEEKHQPFLYSSSIYYGGQDIYSRPQSAQNPRAPTYNKYEAEDDSDSASRGNWWQGSLYY